MCRPKKVRLLMALARVAFQSPRQLKDFGFSRCFPAYTHMKSLLLLCLLLANALAAAETAPARPVEKLRLGAWEDEIGYRQAVRAGNTVFISGTVGSGPMPAAIREAYGILENTLKHYGLTFAHVVKETIHTTDIEALKANLPLRRSYYGKDFPAATWVQVSRLYEPDHVIEIELVAVMPEPAP